MEFWPLTHRQLLVRPEWGTITFHVAQPHIERVQVSLGISDYCQSELLRDDVLNQIKAFLDGALCYPKIYRCV